MKRSFAVFILSAALCQLSSRAQTALTPGSPAISVSPSFVPGSPALSVTPAGQVDTNFTLAALSQALVTLQNNVQQTLPMVALFNDNFDFVSLNQSIFNTNPPPNMAQNLAGNFAKSFAVNTAVSTGSLFNTNPAVNLAPGAPAVGSTPVNSAFAAAQMNRETLRALLVVQSDLERLLPLLNALNGGAANVPGSFTNLFGVVSVHP
jgi:hypothetical protein